MEPIKVLDAGYVRFVDGWGTDESIIEAARMSTDKGFVAWETDEKLLSFLYKNNHATPFEMCGLIVEVKAPIFVFREWHRHRTQSYNEMSARYVPLPDENYLPDADLLAERCGYDGPNKQARGATDRKPTSEEMDNWRIGMLNLYHHIQGHYEYALGVGIPKELARLILPVSRYSKMRASANLRNWIGFLTLRMAPNAQWEIRQYANAVGSIIAERFPRTWKLFLAHNV